MTARKRTPQTLTAALDRSVKTNAALDPDVDAPLIATARMFAEQIDHARDLHAQGKITQTELTKAEYLAPHLQAALTAMLASPKSRAEIAAKAKPQPKATGPSKLATMRSTPGQRPLKSV